MQANVMYGKSSTIASIMSAQNVTSRVCRSKAGEKETIHSGHFMVSDFEAEAQDDEDELAVPVPEEEATKVTILAPALSFKQFLTPFTKEANSSQQLNIETSLNKLFQCMSIAYRQKLTSPKWNRFKGIRLRWKDKIRLNNVIWRCWHMQFILKQNTLVCQFASPLDVDTHNKPEAVVLEGKYWKRKLAAVTAEYKKWRMFYRNKSFGLSNKDGHEMLESVDMLDWSRELVNSNAFETVGNTFGNNNGMSSGDIHNMMVDEDYMELMTDTLFSTITSNQPLYFPDPREIARGANLADFIQPSLGPLQPNLDDFMDTLEPLQEFFNAKLPSVPEEDDVFRSGQLNNSYPDLDIITSMNQTNQVNENTSIVSQKPNVNLQNLQYTSKIYPQSQQGSPDVFRNNLNTVDNFNSTETNFENTLSVAEPQLICEKNPNKAQVKSARTSQYSSTQPNVYQSSAQHSNINFQHTASSQQSQQPQSQSYTINVQSVPLLPASNPLQLPTINEQSNVNNLTQIATDLIEPAQTCGQTSSHQKVLKTTGLSSLSVVKPYKIVQQPPQQGYKYPSPSSNFVTTQFKFGNNCLKNEPHGLDLTNTQQTTNPAKLLPRPVSVSNVDKNEVFAVPKMNYQMKARSKSRSSSSLTTAKINPPPLLSAVSDPSLNVNNNALLAHLLTNNTPNIYAINNTTSKVSPAINQPTNVKHILPMITHESSTVSLNNSPRNAPLNVQSNIQSAPLPVQAQRQQVIQTSSGSQVLMNTSNQTHQSQSTPNSPKDSAVHSPQALNISPLHSPMSMGSPLSPTRAFGKGELERGQYKEQRRVGHIHAEQKRRYNIKNGFDMLHSLIPQLNQNPNTKLSKAAMLQKGAEYIKQLKIERNNLKEEMETLRHQIECLNASISNCQLMLPATGAPVSRSRTNKMKEMFDEYVRIRTRENWKFWIFSILLEPLMSSFNSYVSTKSVEDLCKTTLSWVEQHCSLVDLRPAVLNSLKYLCTATDILTNPGRLQEEALAAVSHTEQHNS